ncbi:MAG TPA: hypothetical protein VFV95_00530 [Vicinamibacterales bacterium]|nr:hypothetical protein [Vicinamibacterales bacterium]
MASPDVGRAVRISVAGGVYPRWTPEGLYYAALDSNQVVRATMKFGVDSVDVESRKELFPVRPALTLITNWPALLDKKS